MIIATVIQRARRRLLCNEIATQGAHTICVALGAIVLLLLLGTQILDWRWLIALPAAAVAVGTCATLRRLPQSYSTARLLDHRLKLADALSTALFFSTPASAGRADEPSRQAQRRQAIRLSENLNLAEAIPFKAPRAMYPAGVLALIGVSLFALRYGLEHRLDLQPSLAHILKAHLGAGNTDDAELRRNTRKKQAVAKDPAGADTDEQTSDPLADAETAANASVDSTQAAQKPADRDRAQADKNGESRGGESGDNAAEQQQPQDGGNQRSGSKSGLLSKLRDAMQNAMSGMKRGLGRSGNGEQAGMRQNASESSSQQDHQAGDGQSAQDAAALGAGQSQDQLSSQQPGSGAGNLEGSKELKLAEKLAAMGQFSRINGERSPNVTGDVTVEVQSGNQQLSTPYMAKRAEHINAAGEINRDEVPLLYQSYVQQYFEEIRKERRPAGKR